MNPTQQRAHRLARTHPTYGARTRLAMARGYDRTDDLAHDLADTIDTRRTISTDDYDDAPAGWELAAAVAYEAAEPDTEGTYSERPTGPDSIDRRRFGQWHEGSRDYRYWTPGAYSFEDYRTDARRAGAGRHDAWRYAWRMLERDELRDQTAHLLPVTVTAYRAGIELGSATICTTRSDADDYEADDLAYLVADLWPEAIDAAEAALAKLCPAR